jgi:hypothetical protein
MFFEEEQPDDDNDQCKQEHKDGNAVDAMHIFYPSATGRIWIFLFDIQVFCQLSQYSHKELLLNTKVNNNSRFVLFGENEFLFPGNLLFFNKSSIFAIPMGD